MTALPIEGYAREFTDASAMLAHYASRKRRLAEILATGIRETPIEKVPPSLCSVRKDRPAARCGNGSRWEEDEVAFLRKLQAERKNGKEIAEALGRTISSVSNKAFSLGLKLEPVPKAVAKNRGRRRRDWLKLHVVDTSPKRADRHLVLTTVCEVTGFTPDDIRGMRRDKHTIIARHIVYLMMKRHTQMSLPQIGSYLGDRDHTTILSGIGSVQHKAATDLDLAHHIESISALINSRVTVSDKPIAVAEAA
jgi:hypothetical protein